jgi:hypothetical protein
MVKTKRPNIQKLDVNLSVFECLGYWGIRNLDPHCIITKLITWISKCSVTGLAPKVNPRFRILVDGGILVDLKSTKRKSFE